MYGCAHLCDRGKRQLNGKFIRSEGPFGIEILILAPAFNGHDSNILPDISSTCSGHHSPTKVVNHVLQCGDNKLSGNKAISMLMTRQLSKKKNSHTFSVFCQKCILIEYYYHMILNILAIFFKMNIFCTVQVFLFSN